MFQLKYKEIDRFKVESEITILFKNADDLSNYINHHCDEWIKWEVSYK